MRVEYLLGLAGMLFLIFVAILMLAYVIEKNLMEIGHILRTAREDTRFIGIGIVNKTMELEGKINNLRKEMEKEN